MYFYIYLLIIYKQLLFFFFAQHRCELIEVQVNCRISITARPWQLQLENHRIRVVDFAGTICRQVGDRNYGIYFRKINITDPLSGLGGSGVSAITFPVKKRLNVGVTSGIVSWLGGRKRKQDYDK